MRINNFSMDDVRSCRASTIFLKSIEKPRDGPASSPEASSPGGCDLFNIANEMFQLAAGVRIDVEFIRYCKLAATAETADK